MNIANAFTTAFRALAKNRMRSALTSIGIIIGVSSVIVMMGMGNSARIAVRDMIFTYGNDAFRVRVPWEETMTSLDVMNLLREVPQIRYITPVFRDADKHIRYRDKRAIGFLFGGNEDFLPLMGRQIIEGREFTDSEVRSMARVVVIGLTLVDELFEGNSPLGELIIIDSVPLEVIGVMSMAGQGFSGDDYDSYTLIPYTTARTRFWNAPGFRDLYISAYNTQEISIVAEQVRDYFRRKYNLRPHQADTFEIHKSEDKLQIADEISRALALLLAGIASISLFVGGVGIMNIMLVSVTERTREIGIRMAVGARERDIMMQFLVEAVTLSSLGGAVGISLGLALYFTIVYFAGWPFIFSISYILLAALFAAAVGIFFGYYPSKKAASLHPIEALRYE